jgi:hypothetical protein
MNTPTSRTTTWRDHDDREAREATIAADLAAELAQLATQAADTWW